MRKKINIWIPMLLILGLTACSNKGIEEGETVQDSEQFTEETKSNGTVSLRVWGGEADQELVEQMIASFKEKYKGEANFDISYEVVVESECKDTLLKDPEAGADVFAFVDDMLGSMVAGGAISPIDYADEVSARDLPGAVEAATVNGKIYAYPETADNGYFMYYNDEYFEEEDVTSFEKMLDIAAQNDKKVTIDFSSGWMVFTFFGNTGLTVGLNEDGVTNYCDWNSTENAIKGVDVAQRMLDYVANPGFMPATDEEFVKGIQSGKIIAGVSGTWNATLMEKTWKEHYKACKLPTYEIEGQTLQMASFSGYKMIGVNKYSDNHEWAEKLANWMTNEENQTLRFEVNAQGPSNINVQKLPEVQDSPAIKAVLEQSEYAQHQMIGTKYWLPVAALGNTIAQGNPENRPLQEIMDELVKNVTAPVTQ